MENLKYFDFSVEFGNSVSAILSKKNNFMKKMSHQERIYFFGNIFNIDKNKFGIPLQTHSINCKIIEDCGSFENTDGLITENENIVLSLSVADCCPVYIYDTELKIRGLVHSGWKGTVKKICKNAIVKFLSLKSNLSNLKFFLGPSIGLCCYEVKDDVAKYFYDQCKIKTNNGKYLVNIREQIKTDLLKSGVNTNQIKISSICTLEHSKCESYRREQENSGRMIALFGEIKY